MDEKSRNKETVNSPDTDQQTKTTLSWKDAVNKTTDSFQPPQKKARYSRLEEASDMGCFTGRLSQLTASATSEQNSWSDVCQASSIPDQSLLSNDRPTFSNPADCAETKSVSAISVSNHLVDCLVDEDLNSKGETGTASNDEECDATDLVLSVIKNKVDIQTMKLCLQCNVQPSSSRSSQEENSESDTARSGSSRPIDGNEIQSEDLDAADSGSQGSSNASSCSELQEQRERLAATTSEGSRSDLCRGIVLANPLVDAGLTPGSVESSGICQPSSSQVPSGRLHGYLEQWHDQHSAKAIVDNAINRTIEEMTIGSGVFSGQSPSQVEQSNDGAGAMASSISEQRLRERLQPLISQLTQASELVFARNIERVQTSANSEG